MKRVMLVLALVSFGVCFTQDAKKSENKVVKVIKTVNRGLDTVLTPKGALKTLIILSPIIIYYCNHYNYDPAKLTIEKIVNLIGYSKECYRLQESYGKSAAYFEVLSKTPKKSFTIVAQDFIDKLVNKGVPFATALLATRLISRGR